MTPATTTTIAAPVAMIFSFNDDVVFRALDGLTPSQLWHRPTERNNPMLWVAGHLVQSRAMVLRLLGEPVETGWGDLFDRGASIGDAGRYPSREEIERVMREVTPRLHSKLAALDDASLARPASMGLPFAKSLADELSFFALHDAYTVGQMGYIRKALGYPGLVG
jgi:DinB superfamily